MKTFSNYLTESEFKKCKFYSFEKGEKVAYEIKYGGGILVLGKKDKNTATVRYIPKSSRYGYKAELPIKFKSLDELKGNKSDIETIRYKLENSSMLYELHILIEKL